MAGTKRLELVIAGDASGALRSLSEVEGESGSLASKLKSFGGTAGAAFLGVAATAGAVVVGLGKIGETFKNAFDTIRSGTGATGPALKGLENDFNAVFTSVPVSAGDAASAISLLNQRLGLTGKPLQTLTEQFTELSRMQGGDLATNIATVTGALNEFGISAGQQSPKLDELFRVSQQTGVGVDALATAMSKGGPAFQQAGLSFEQSAAFLGLLNKAGIPTGRSITGLNTAIKKAADEGKPASQVFAQLWNEITSGKDKMQATKDATDLFGSTLGVQLVQQISSGQLNYQQLTDSISKGGDTILKAGEETQNFGEKFTILKNKALTALEPLGLKVEDFGTMLEEKLPGAIDTASAALQKGWTAVEKVFESPRVQAALQAIVEIVSSAFEIIKTVFTAATVVISDLWNRFGQHLVDNLRTVLGGIVQQVQGAFEILAGIFELIRDILTGKWGAAWDAIKQIVQGAWDFIEGLVRQAVGIVSTIIGAAMAGISALWDAQWHVIEAVFSGIWNGIQAAVGAGISAVVSFFGSLPGRAAGAMSSLGGAIVGVINGAMSWALGVVASGVNGIVGFFASLPGRIAGGFSSLGSALTGAFKSAWNAFANSITLPSIHIPGTNIDIGGGHPIPRIHTGGIVPGVPGQEVMAILQAGEGVISRPQMSAISSQARSLPSGGIPTAAAGGGTVILNINVEGSVMTERDLVQTIRTGLLDLQRKSPRPVLPGVSA